MISASGGEEAVLLCETKYVHSYMYIGNQFFHPFLVKAKLEAKKRDLEHSEKQLEDAKQCLKEKVEECKAFEVSG